MNVLKRNIFACFMGFAVLSVFNVNQAFAVDKGGFFLEPLISYEMGEPDSSYPAPFGAGDTELNGFGAGLRLGFHALESIFIGADGRYSIAQFKSDSLDEEIDTKSFNYGPTVGVQMPFLIGLRAWGTYVLGGEVDPDGARGIDENFTEADGWRLGAGMKVGFASLNVEYQDITYDEAVAGTAVELVNQSWVFSVSFPMSM